jgi:GNAT superfamily N-acetyltransferase
MTTGALEDIVRFTRRTSELTADEVHAIEHGWIFNTPSIQVAWGLNYVRLREPMGFDEVVELAEEAQSHLPFRRITLEPGAHTPELEAKFTAAGWKPERDLLMLHTRAPEQAIDTSAVIEVDEAEHLRLGRMWSLEEGPGTGDDVLRSLTEFWSRESRVCGDLFLGVRRDEIVAKTKLRCDGRIAQVEDVYTIAPARGQGLCRALVTRAVELARAQGHELIFIIADADDWPRHLYAQLGFEPVGMTVNFQGSGRVPRESRSRRRTALKSA